MSSGTGDKASYASCIEAVSSFCSQPPRRLSAAPEACWWLPSQNAEHESNETMSSMRAPSCLSSHLLVFACNAGIAGHMHSKALAMPPMVRLPVDPKNPRTASKLSGADQLAALLHCCHEIPRPTSIHSLPLIGNKQSPASKRQLFQFDGLLTLTARIHIQAFEQHVDVSLGLQGLQATARPRDRSEAFPTTASAGTSQLREPLGRPKHKKSTLYALHHETMPRVIRVRGETPPLRSCRASDKNAHGARAKRQIATTPCPSTLQPVSTTSNQNDSECQHQMLTRRLEQMLEGSVMYITPSLP